MRDEWTFSNETAGEISSHVAEFGDDNEVEHVKMPGGLTCRQAWRHIDDFCDKIEKPEDVKESEQREGHAFKRRTIASDCEHLPGEHDEKHE